MMKAEDAAEDCERSKEIAMEEQDHVETREGEEGSQQHMDGEAVNGEGEEQQTSLGLITFAPEKKKRREDIPKWVRPRRAVMVPDKFQEMMSIMYEEMAEAFLAIDMNGDGRVTLRELKAGFSQMEATQDLTEEDINAVMAIGDADSNGYIDLKEFLASFGPHAVSKEEVRAGLSNLARSAQGKRPAFLNLKVNKAMLNSVEILAEYINLQFVDLSHNLISDLEPLGRLEHLISIDASHNRLDSVLYFRAPNNLRHANLSNNVITKMNDISHHRSLQTLDLSHNKISFIEGISRNMLLKKLLLDENRILQITGLHNLPIQHLSLKNNKLTAVNGHALMQDGISQLQAALEHNFDAMEDAFEMLDASEDGRVSRKELRQGLVAIHVLDPLDTSSNDKRIMEQQDDINKLLESFMDSLDRNLDGTIDLNEFTMLFKKRGDQSSNDIGISSLMDLELIDLSGNTIASLKGMEGHPRLRTINMSKTAVRDFSELGHLAFLPMLEDVDLTGTPAAMPTSSSAQASCFRVKAINLLLPPGGKTKLTMLNHVMVSAEERVASANFHDPNHLQFKDTKRSDAQDLPADLFR